jgi:hypothetical protein
LKFASFQGKMNYNTEEIMLSGIVVTNNFGKIQKTIFNQATTTLKKIAKCCLACRQGKSQFNV